MSAQAFNRGFHRVVSGSGGEMFRIFRPEELELLICGATDLDFLALERAAQYQVSQSFCSPSAVRPAVG